MDGVVRRTRGQAYTQLRRRAPFLPWARSVCRAEELADRRRWLLAARRRPIVYRSDRAGVIVVSRIDATASVEGVAAKRKLPAGPRRVRNPVKRVGGLLRFLRDPLGVVHERFERYGDVYLVDEGQGRKLFVTRHPDAIRDVLVTNAASFRKAGGANDRLRPILGNGLLVADGEAWRRKRRLLQPAFRAKAISSYAATMVEHAEALQFGRDQVVDVSDAMMRLTLVIVCKALFDHDVTGDTDTVARAMDALREASQPDLWPAFVPTPRRRRARRAIGDIDALIESLVAGRRAETDPDRTDLLTALHAAGLEGRELRDELVTLFLAGHETTSHALTWTLVLLAEHFEVLRELEGELDAQLGGRAPSLDDLSKLSLVDQVVSEAMRLYPPAFALPRVATGDVEVMGFPVSAGDQVVCWVWHCHRDGRWFPNPEAFQPRRFEQATFPSHAFIPFGAGSRMCIGAGFAHMEMRLLLASLLRRYRFVADGPRPALAPRVTLAPRSAVWMRIEHRG